jgi:hypothetical protein
MVDATLGTILQTEGQRRQWQNAPEVGPTPRNPDTEYPQFSSLKGCWADQSEMVVLFGTLLTYLEWLTKPLSNVTPCVRPFVLDTRGSPLQWTNICTPFSSPHPRAKIPIPVLTRS